MGQPDFIIIGAMKSATSSLHEQLGTQPGIFVSDPKEPNFFSDDDQYGRGFGWYSSLFAEAREGDLCGESSTHYAKLPTYPNTVSRMKAALPDVRLVYVMRHPVDRLISHYIHEWTQNVIRCDINEALELHPELISYGQYAYQLGPYFEAFGRDSVLPVFFRGIKVSPQRELERVARFIGYGGPVTWQDAMGSQNVSAERLRRFPGYDVLIESAPLAWLRRTFVPRRLRQSVKDRLRMKQRPTLSPSNVARAVSAFDEDLSQLSAWLGVQLDCTNFDAVTERQLDWVA